MFMTYSMLFIRNDYNMSQKSNHIVSRAWRLAILDYHEVVLERVIRKDTTKVKLRNVTHNRVKRIVEIYFVLLRASEISKY